MIRPMMTVVAIGVLLTAGCTTPQMKQDPMVQKTESKVLRTAFAEALAEWADIIEQEKGKLPPEATRPDFVVRSMEMMKDRCPSLFMVSAREEADFEAGMFHDDDNKKRMKQSFQKLDDYDAALPLVSQFLIHKLSNGKLEGAQLELATRLLSSHVDEARARAERMDAEQTSPADQTYTTYEVRSLTGWSLWRFRYEGAKSKIRLTLQNETHPSSAVIDFTRSSHPPQEVILALKLRPDRGTLEYQCGHVFGHGSFGRGGELQFFQIGSCNSMELHEVGALGTEDARLVTLDVKSKGEDGGTVKVPVTIRLEN